MHDGIFQNNDHVPNATCSPFYGLLGWTETALASFWCQVAKAFAPASPTGLYAKLSLLRPEVSGRWAASCLRQGASTVESSSPGFTAIQGVGFWGGDVYI